MSSDSALEIPVGVLHRWQALQELRARRAAGRCDCGCKKCTNRETSSSAQRL